MIIHGRPGSAPSGSAGGDRRARFWIAAGIVVAVGQIAVASWRACHGDSDS